MHALMPAMCSTRTVKAKFFLLTEYVLSFQSRLQIEAAVTRGCAVKDRMMLLQGALISGLGVIIYFSPLQNGCLSA